jgi:hypothetical protein
LKVLDLKASNTGGEIGPQGAQYLADMLSVNGALTALNLSSNIIGGHWVVSMQHTVSTPEGPKAIAEALLVNGGLTALDLSSNDLEDEGVSAVCKAIQSNKETKLASLNMGTNSISPLGAKSVAAMVAVTGALTSIDLSYNQLCGVRIDHRGRENGTYTAAGIIAIADALRVNGALTKIE